jgi:hypothetical protein
MFLDTSGLFCSHHADEPRSDDAQTMFEAARTTTFLLNWLSLACGLPRPKTLAFLKVLLGHPEVEVVWVGAGLNEEAINLRDARPLRPEPRTKKRPSRRRPLT